MHRQATHRTVLGNLLADIALTAADPRSRLEPSTTGLGRRASERTAPSSTAPSPSRPSPTFEAISAPWEGLAGSRWPGSSAPPDALSSTPMYQHLGISIDGQQASLGYQQVHLPAARLDRATVAGHGGPRTSVSLPAGGAHAVMGDVGRSRAARGMRAAG
jgi:hypothetical protein